MIKTCQRPACLWYFAEYGVHEAGILAEDQGQLEKDLILALFPFAVLLGLILPGDYHN